MEESNAFTAEQQNYLQGFALGADVARKVQGLPVIAGSAAAMTTNTRSATITLGPTTVANAAPTVPDRLQWEAQEQQVAAGGKLCPEELAKREKNPLDRWDEIRNMAERHEFPTGTDVLLHKYQGLFYVAPAQNAYMCRLRFPGGAVRSWQLRALGDLADNLAGGYADVTTRANLQLREIAAADAVRVIMGLRDLGIINLGAGADNIRNVTASPLSGIDRAELIETLPLARDMHYYILNHREMYGLPRKFNIAFDGGGAISSLDDTNDIGFHAVRLRNSNATDCTAGEVLFQLALGGITGHRDFARDTGVVARPEECVLLAAAIVRVFIAHGDRTDRKKARLKYILDSWGFEKFLAEAEKELGRPLRRMANDDFEPRRPDDRHAHVGVHPQKQAGLNYLGVVLPVGRILSRQLRGLAEIAERCGNGDIRLTPWQNLLITNIPNERVDDTKAQIEDIGLDWHASSARAGVIACTGNAGCKYAASDTKRDALAIADYVDQRLELDQPINIHLTGCSHSCAQHYIGDIGLLGANVEVGEDVVEGYQVFIGGGYGERRQIGRELFPPTPADDMPRLVAHLLEVYLQQRKSLDEGFAEFTNRYEIEQLRALFSQTAALTTA
jgi:ferredoxin-nitrite reductase